MHIFNTWSLLTTNGFFSRKRVIQISKCWRWKWNKCYLNNIPSSRPEWKYAILEFKATRLFRYRMLLPSKLHKLDMSSIPRYKDGNTLTQHSSIYNEGQFPRNRNLRLFLFFYFFVMRNVQSMLHSSWTMVRKTFIKWT